MACGGISRRCRLWRPGWESNPVRRSEGPPAVSFANPETYSGARGKSRTYKTRFLRPVRMPIPSLGRIGGGLATPVGLSFTAMPCRAVWGDGWDLHPRIVGSRPTSLDYLPTVTLGADTESRTLSGRLEACYPPTALPASWKRIPDLHRQSRAYEARE